MIYNINDTQLHTKADSIKKSRQLKKYIKYTFKISQSNKPEVKNLTPFGGFLLFKIILKSNTTPEIFYRPPLPLPVCKT